MRLNGGMDESRLQRRQEIRLMFRHERNLNVLEQWADQVLDGCMWSESAVEDYRNYIKYLKAHDEKLAAQYQKMLDEMINEEIEDNENEDG